MGAFTFSPIPGLLHIGSSLSVPAPASHSICSAYNKGPESLKGMSYSFQSLEQSLLAHSKVWSASKRILSVFLLLHWFALKKAYSFIRVFFFSIFSDFPSFSAMPLALYLQRHYIISEGPQERVEGWWIQIRSVAGVPQDSQLPHELSCRC